MIFVGLDLHKRYITACALDVLGNLLVEERRLATDLAVLLGWLGRLTGPVTVVLEATLYWAWLERQLSALGYVVQLAHSYQVKLIWQARKKTDPINARKLAELARVHLLPAIRIPDPATRAQRQLLRGRAFLVRQRMVLKNRIHAYVTAGNRRCPALDLYSRAGRAWLTTFSLPPVVRPGRSAARQSGSVSPRRSWRSTSTSSATLGRIRSPSPCRASRASGPSARCCSRPRSAPAVASARRTNSPPYAGLVTSRQSSGGKTHHGAIGRGSPWLRWIVIESFKHTNWRPGPWAPTIKSSCARRESRKPPSPRRGSSVYISTGC